MLTIKKISGSQAAAEYYAKYAQDKGEVQGYWVDHSGQIATNGAAVDHQAMVNLLKGYTPDGKAALCQNPGEGHQPGWDLTFSPPKSVSIAWSNAPEALRNDIELAHKQAVAQALEFINDEATSVRVGKGGGSVSKARLLAALFQHSSNRAEEPQLHTHAVVFNVAKTEAEGKWRTLHPYPIYRAYMAAGALYKAELADRMRILGFSIHRTKDSFELSQIPEAVCVAQSSRSKAIEAALDAKGLTRSTASALTKELIALDTRSEKGTERIVQDFSRWQNENTGFGFGPKELAVVLDQQALSSEYIPYAGKDTSEVMGECLQKITDSSSTFNVFEIYRAAAEAAICENNTKQTLVMVRDALNSTEIRRLGPNAYGEERYSTKDMIAIEQEIMSIVGARQTENLHHVDKPTVNQVLLSRQTIAPEQADALNHIVRGNDGVAFIEGDAGTGKSFLMAAVRAAYENSGYTVRGISFTNKAAKNLEDGSGIRNCQSVDSFLLDQGQGQRILDSKTVLVLDEAGMLDSRKMLKLMRMCKDHGSKLICVGDQKQIQPIAAGQAFGSMKREFGAKRLSEIMRQKDEWLRGAIKDFSEGKARQGLDTLDQHGGLQILPGRYDARKAIISEWRQQTLALGLAKAPLIVVSTNAEVAHLNFLARDQLVKNGVLDQGSVLNTDHGQHCFTTGDRIVFTANFKKKGILNSGVATIANIKKSPNPYAAKTLTVITENGRRIKFNPAAFQGFRHGYAITAHKSQGSTVDRVLVLVDSSLMDREKFYVAVSRGREQPVVFADRQMLGVMPEEERQRSASLSDEEKRQGEHDFFKTSLGRLIGASHEKDTTQDYPAAQAKPGHDHAQNVLADEKIWNSIKCTIIAQIRAIHERLSLAFGNAEFPVKSHGIAEKSVEHSKKEMSYDI